MRTRTHGKPSTYTTGGCRCEHCKEAHSEWRRLRRQAASQMPPTGEVKPCVVCGVGEVRRRAREEPAVFAKRKTCSSACMAVLSVHPRWESNPHTVGRRTLLARTCPDCGLLLPASAFSADGRKGGVRGLTCGTCRARKDRKQMSDERRARVNTHHSRDLRRRNEATREAASRNGYEWTGPELEILASRPELSVAQLAAMLGRTYAGVVGARVKLKHDPRYQRLAGRSE